MEKCFVLSVRTIMSKPNVTQSFDADNMVVVPMAVINEIQERYRENNTERSEIARKFLDYISKWTLSKLQVGVIQDNGSILKVYSYVDTSEIRHKLKGYPGIKNVELQLLATCKELNQFNSKVILVSKNTALRMNAQLLGIEAQTFKDEMLPEIDEQYTGRGTVYVTDSEIDSYYEKRSIPISEKMKRENEIYENMFITLKSCTSNKSAIGRVEGNKIVPLVFGEDLRPYGVMPKNVGQKFMIEALMMDVTKAPLVIIKGSAGTAKTFMALAAGLEHSVERKEFSNNILISRSPTETGEKIGYLPGGEEAKIGPYLRGIMDNLKALHDSGKQQKNEMNPEEYYFDRGIIKAEAVGFIRGRSICDTYIIIDEAQNLTPVEIKTIITRVGIGTKLVIIGDPAQIDRPELTERNNGLSYASERLKGLSTCWQLTMEDKESVRSELARSAAQLL